MLSLVQATLLLLLFFLQAWLQSCEHTAAMSRREKQRGGGALEAAVMTFHKMTSKSTRRFKVIARCAVLAGPSQLGGPSHPQAAMANRLVHVHCASEVCIECNR